MIGLIKLLKRNNFKKGSLFLIKKHKVNRDISQTEKGFFPNINNMTHSKIQQLKDSRKVNLFNKKNSKSNKDYDDLFFYFLQINDKIDEFEVSTQINKHSENNQNIQKYNDHKFEEDEDNSDVKRKPQKSINVNEIFYSELYLGLISNKIQWNNFSFSKGIYNLMYRKSKAKQKEISKFCLKYNENYETIINSYEKKYTSLTYKHNWELSPLWAFRNYKNLCISKNLSQSKEKTNKKINSLVPSLCDIVVKVNNNGQGKTLIYIGKNYNIYLDDYLRDNSNNNLISMQVQDSISKHKYRKEIVYDYNDFKQKSKLRLQNSLSYNKKINKIYNNLNIHRNNKNILIKNIKKTNNYNTTFGKFGNTKEKYLDKNNIHSHRFNTENNKLSLNTQRNKNFFSYNSIFNHKVINTEKNDESLSPLDKIKNNDYLQKRRNFKEIPKIEEYKQFIINDKNHNLESNCNQISFSPNSYKPIILKGNYTTINSNNDNENDLENCNKKNKNKIYLTKLIMKKKLQKEKTENNQKKPNILNYFKNKSDFYY